MSCAAFALLFHQQTLQQPSTQSNHRTIAYVSAFANQLSALQYLQMDASSAMRNLATLVTDCEQGLYVMHTFRSRTQIQQICLAQMVFLRQD